MVVIPADHASPQLVGEVLLAGATGVLLHPGADLTGWSFIDDATISRGSAEERLQGHLRAVDSLGLAIWVQERRLAGWILEQGVPATWIGWGAPLEAEPPRKYIDLLVIEGAPGWEEGQALLARLGDFSQATAAVGSGSLTEDVGRSRILIWPKGPEAATGLWRQALLLDTLPVSPEPSSPGLLPAVPPELFCRRPAMEARVRQLLSDRVHLRRLASSAGGAARREGDWSHFVGRVQQALSALPSPAAAPALRQIGRALRHGLPG